MDKKQEIEILQSLKGDTYFAEFFGGLDIDLMCENIKNDHPIELGCSFNSKCEALEKEKRETISKMNDRIDNIIRAVIDSSKGDLDDDLFHVLAGEVGILFISKYKFTKGYELSDREIGYLLGFVEKHLGE